MIGQLIKECNLCQFLLKTARQSLNRISLGIKEKIKRVKNTGGDNSPLSLILLTIPALVLFSFSLDDAFCGYQYTECSLTPINLSIYYLIQACGYMAVMIISFVYIVFNQSRCKINKLHMVLLFVGLSQNCLMAIDTIYPLGTWVLKLDEVIYGYNTIYIAFAVLGVACLKKRLSP